MATPTDGHWDSAVMHEISDAVEALSNLIYLIKADAGDAQKVRAYAASAEEPLKRLCEIVEREFRRRQPN